MPFAAIIYASRSLIAADGPEMAELIRQSTANNRARGVTGALYFDGANFFQTIEGPRDAVESLFATILTDPRHRDVRELARSSITARRFAAWEMKMVDGAHFAHLRRYFALESLRTADKDGLDRRLRLLKQL